MTKEFERALMPDKPGGHADRKVSMGPAMMMADPNAPNGTRWYSNPYCAELEQIGSFKQYLLRQYKNDYLATMKQMVSECQVPELADRTATWGNVQFFASQLALERIDFYYKSQEELYADLIFSCELVCQCGSRLIQQAPEWFQLRTVSVLNPEHLSFNNPISVGIYERSAPVPGIPLDDYLVPYTSTELLDAESSAILGTYYPEALESPCPIDGRLLAARMGLNVQCFYLDTDQDIRGQFYYEGQQISVLGRSKQPMKRSVKANTIVVNLAECLDDNGEPSDIRVNDTIVHECFHAYRHRLFYLGQRLYNKDFRCLSCNIAGQSEAAVIGSSALQVLSFQPELAAEAADQMAERSPLDWIEWQAHSVTPRIRMPIQTFPGKAQELLERYADLPEPQRFSRVICELAVIYKVSRLMAKIRMIELGWEQAQGVLNFVNGHYAEDYTVADSVLPKGETYTLDFKTALDLYANDKHFREILSQGWYPYVDGHFVLKSEKYLRSTKDGLVLTDYAKSHMSECCLRFRLHRKKQEHTYKEGVLYQIGIEYCDVFAEYLAGGTGEAGLLAASQKMIRILHSLPPRADSTLETHMIQRHVKVGTLTALSGVSPRTLRRIRNSSGYRPSKETAIAICLGLKLEPIFSFDWLSKLGIHLENTSTDCLYNYVLNTMYFKPISEVNQLLELNGLPPLCNNTDELLN